MVAVATLVLAALLPAAPAVASGFYSVTTQDDTDDGTCDSFHCSLREAINAANGDLSPGPDTIQIPAGSSFSPFEIHILTPLPPVAGDVLIEVPVSPFGGSPPQTGIVDGADVGVGLDFQAGASILRGVAVGGFDVGIRVGSGAAGTVLERNAVGFGADGFSPVANGDGIVVEANDVLVGQDPNAPSGPTSSGNRIANNTGIGVRVAGSATGVTISGNEVRDNGGLGIDLEPPGVDVADDDDLDGGPNGSQNAPVLTTVETLGQITTISGTLESTPNTTFTIDVYSVNSCDPSGFGEGEFLALSTQVTTDGAGEGSFSMGTNVFSGTPFATATATAPDGSTSEFSNCHPRTVVVQSDINLSGTPNAATIGTGEPLRYDWTIRNDGPSDATGVTFQQTVPPDVTIGRVQGSGATCAAGASTVTCTIGNLTASQFGGPPGTAGVTVHVLAGAVGTLSTTGSIDSTSPDPDASDDSATLNTAVVALTPQTFTVTDLGNTNDGSCAAHCTLREALNAANANPGRDRIEFAIAGTIAPTGAWPTISRPVVIDASTAPGYGGSPVVEINSAGITFQRPIWITGGNTEIRGLTLNRFSVGINVEAWGGNLIVGNHIGTNMAGTAGAGTRTGTGIHLGTTPGNQIGGPSAPEMNVISNVSTGIHFGNDPGSAGGSVAHGNIIGLARDGQTLIGNVVGVAMGGPNNVLGGSAPGEGNVISGNTQQAVGDGAVVSSGNVIRGNVIGLTADQTAARPNGYGVEVNGPAAGTLIGGDQPGEGNIIAGNTREGVFIWNGASQTKVFGNWIGTNQSGAAGLGNAGHGVQLGFQGGQGGVGTEIGGIDPNRANVIAYNTKDGVFRDSADGQVLGNSIHSNGELGIDRNPNGVSSTSTSRFPTLTAATTAAGMTTIEGGLASAAPNTAHRIEFFANSACDSSGNGEGQTFLGSASVTTDASGSASFSVGVSAVAGGTFITATSTAAGQTSEFSGCVASVALGPVEEPTPTGTNVGVEPIDFTTGETPVFLSFDNVTTAGTTTLVTSDTGPATPVGFQLGDPATYYQIDTSAVFDGLVTICISYAGVSFADEGGLRLLHYDDDTGLWEDVTTSHDTVGDVICGRTDSFSPFAIVQRDFTFSGIFGPVNNLPTVNVAKAGSVIPLTFGLGGEFGFDVFAAGFPVSQRVTCEAGVPLDVIESTVAAGTSSLQYDPLTERYTYVWKTEKSWANTCRQLTLTFVDGTTVFARFDLRR